MKKLLSLLGATGLIATTSATVVACGDSPADKTWDQLAVESAKKAIEKDGGWFNGTEVNKIKEAGINAAKKSIGNDSWLEFDKVPTKVGQKTVEVNQTTLREAQVINFTIQAYESVAADNDTFKWEKVGSVVNASTKINELKIINISEMNSDLTIKTEATSDTVIAAFIEQNDLPSNIELSDFTAEKAAAYAIIEEDWTIKAAKDNKKVEGQVTVKVTSGQVTDLSKMEIKGDIKLDAPDTKDKQDDIVIEDQKVIDAFLEANPNLVKDEVSVTVSPKVSYKYTEGEDGQEPTWAWTKDAKLKVKAKEGSKVYSGEKNIDLNITSK